MTKIPAVRSQNRGNHFKFKARLVLGSSQLAGATEKDPVTNKHTHVGIMIKSFIVVTMEIK